MLAEVNCYLINTETVDIVEHGSDLVAVFQLASETDSTEEPGGILSIPVPAQIATDYLAYEGDTTDSGDRQNMAEIIETECDELMQKLEEQDSQLHSVLLGEVDHGAFLLVQNDDGIFMQNIPASITGIVLSLRQGCDLYITDNMPKSIEDNAHSSHPASIESETNAFREFLDNVSAEDFKETI